MPSKGEILASLVALEVNAKKLATAREKEYEQGLRDYLNDREPLLQRRFELVKGAAAPSSEEMEGYAGPRGSVGSKGVPFFWLNVLLGHEGLAEIITVRDRHCLEYLNDVRFQHGNAGMLVELHFCKNPFFEEKVLRRGIYLETDSSGKATRMREECTNIDWKDGRSLLVKELSSGRKDKKKAKKGKKGKKGVCDEEGEDGDVATAAGPKRYKPVPSFFRFFMPSAGVAAGGRKQDIRTLDPTALDPSAEEEATMMPLEDEDDEEVEEAEVEAGSVDGGGAKGKDPSVSTAKKQRDWETLEMLVKRVLPRAVHLYLESPMQVSSSSSGGARGEEDNEDEDGFQMVDGSDLDGDVGSLPPAVQMTLHALQANQAALDELALQFKTLKWQAAKVEYVARQEIANKRRDALIKGIEGDPHVTIPTSVPNFWLRALRSQDSIVHAMTARDEHLLASLADVRVCWAWNRMPCLDYPYREAIVEFHFLPNPYLSNTVLQKRYTFGCVGGSMRRLNLEKSETLEAPQWKEGRDLTVRPPLTKSSKPRQVASFFCIFKKGAVRQAFNIVGDSKQSYAEAVEAEQDYFTELASAVVLRPKELYDQVDMDDELGDEDEDEEDAVGNEDDDDDDEHKVGEGSCRKKARSSSSSKANAGFQLSNGHLLMAMLAFMLLAQVFMFLDFTASWKSTMR